MVQYDQKSSKSIHIMKHTKKSSRQHLPKTMGWPLYQILHFPAVVQILIYFKNFIPQGGRGVLKKWIWFSLLNHSFFRLFFFTFWTRPDQTRPDQTRPDHSKWVIWVERVKMDRNWSTWVDMDQNGSKLVEMVSIWHQSAPNCSRRLQMAQNDSKLHQIASHWLKRLPVAPICSKLLQITPNCSKSL